MEDWLKNISNLSPYGVRQRNVYDVKPDDWRLTSSGLAVPKSAIPKRPPLHIDLFAGAGGFGLGVTAAGFWTIAASDNDIYSALTYMYNLCSYPVRIICPDPKLEAKLQEEMEKWIFGKGKKGKKAKQEFETGGIIPVGAEEKHAGMGYIKEHPEMRGCPYYFLIDVRDLTGQMMLDEIGLKQGEVDLVTGGPPCQGFSYAGRRDVMDPRNSLVFDFARLITEIKPKTFVFENVPGIINMVTKEGEPVLDRFCRMLEEGGYQEAEAIKKMVTGDPAAKIGVVHRARASRSAAELRKRRDSFSDEDEEDEPGMVQGSLF